VTADVLNPGGTAPFNMTLLGEALERRMKLVFAEFRLRASNPDATGAPPLPEAVEPVTIFLGSVKSRERADDASEIGAKFPLVLVKPRVCIDYDDDNGERRSIIQVDFAIGVRRIGNDGYLDVAAIAGRIRTNLLRAPLIESRARLELPLHSEIGDDESFPQWFGVVSANFNVPQPVEETET
jgi:hypothetical protein